MFADNNLRDPDLAIKVSPNPMNQYAVISLSTPNQSRIVVNIFSIEGKKIRTLFANNDNVGNALFTWDGKMENGSEAEPGIYICRVVSNGFRGTVKIVKY